MSGNLAVTNVLATLSGMQPVSKIDTNFDDVETYVNAREITLDVLANRPAAGTHGRFFYATDNGTLYVDTGVAWQSLTPSSAIPYSRSGLTLSNDAGTPNTVLDIAAGAITSDDATIGNRIIMTTAALTKNMNAPWAVGTGNGGNNAAATLANSTWYEVFLIERADTGVVDVMCDVTLTPALPASYTKKQRIGYFKTDGSAHIIAFVQTGTWFEWVTPVLDINDTNPGAARQTKVLPSVPPRIRSRVTMNTQVNNVTTAGLFAIFSSPDAADLAPSTTVAPLYNAGQNIAATQTISRQIRLQTSVAGAVAYRVNAATGVADVIRGVTIGWEDPLGG